MARHGQRNHESLEIVLEKWHLAFLGVAATVVVAGAFFLGMMAQRSWYGPPPGLASVEEVKSPDPPRLFPDRSTSPNIEKGEFGFYDELTGKKKREPKESPGNGRGSTRTSKSTSPHSGNQPSVLVAAASSSNSGKPARRDDRGLAPKTSQNTTTPPKPATKTSPAKRPVRLSLQPDKQGDFALQISSLSSREKALESLKRLRKKGYPSFIERARLANGKLVFRVQIGTYSSRERAKQVAAMLQKELGKGALVRKVK